MSQEEGNEHTEGVEPYLREHGPSPRSDLPLGNLSVEQLPDVELFSPHRGALAGRPTVGVGYLPTHSPKEVVQAWISENHDRLEDLSRSSVTRRIKQRYDERWVDAWRRCAQEAGIKTHQSAPADAGRDPHKHCPRCGEEVSARRFVKHLQECK